MMSRFPLLDTRAGRQFGRETWTTDELTSVRTNETDKNCGQEDLKGNADLVRITDRGV